MGTRLETKKGKNLYEYWGSKIAKAINAVAEDSPIVNLASLEYFKAVDLKALKSPVINIQFKEYRDGKYKVVGLFAKQARGMMTDFAIKNKLTDPEKLKTFNREGYEFSDSLSTDQDWVFVR
jgi:cytoplasmic iron level regulating protein YaaA (DUF328/UPF0246 family)